MHVWNKCLWQRHPHSFNINLAARRKQNQSFDHIAQLSDISRPGMLLQNADCIGPERNRLPPVLQANLLCEMLNKCWNVLWPLSQRRKYQREDVDAVKQILT